MLPLNRKNRKLIVRAIAGQLRSEARPGALRDGDGAAPVTGQVDLAKRELACAWNACRSLNVAIVMHDTMVQATMQRYRELRKEAKWHDHYSRIHRSAQPSAG
jgi:hypothetical protein